MTKKRIQDPQEPYRGFVDEILKGRHLPETVRTYTIRIGEDSEGDPAVWVEFVVDNDLKPSKAKLNELTELVDSVSRELISRYPQRWPYVRLRAAA